MNSRVAAKNALGETTQVKGIYESMRAPVGNDLMLEFNPGDHFWDSPKSGRQWLVESHSNQKRQKEQDRIRATNDINCVSFNLREEADDIFQELAAELLERSDLFGSFSQLQTWYRTTVINRCIDKVRTIKRHRERPLPDELSVVDAPFFDHFNPLFLDKLFKRLSQKARSVDYFAEFCFRILERGFENFLPPQFLDTEELRSSAEKASSDRQRGAWIFNRLKKEAELLLTNEWPYCDGQTKRHPDAEYQLGLLKVLDRRSL